MSVMVEQQLHYMFSECSTGDLICLKENAICKEDNISSLTTLVDPHISSLESVNSQGKGCRNNNSETVILNASYTIPKIKTCLPTIDEVSCEHSNSNVNINSIDSDKFVASCFSNIDKCIDKFKEFSSDGHNDDLINFQGSQMPEEISEEYRAKDKSSDNTESDDSLGIISDLVNDSADTWDNLVFDNNFSDIKLWHSAPLPPSEPCYLKVDSYANSFANEVDENNVSPVSPCCKNTKIHVSEDVCSPIPNILVPMYASTPNHVFMKKLTANLYSSEQFKNYIDDISPQSPVGNVSKVLKDEKPAVNILKSCKKKDENCVAALNATFPLNCNLSNNNKEYCNTREFCAVKDPELSSPNEMHECIENVIKHEKELDSPLKAMRVDDMKTKQTTFIAEEVAYSLDKTQIINKTFSTQNCTYEKIEQSPLKLHSAEAQKELKVQHEPEKDVTVGYSLDQKSSVDPHKKSFFKKDKNNVNSVLNAPVSLLMSFSPKTSNSHNVTKSRKTMFQLSQTSSKPVQNNKNKNEKTFQNSSTLSTSLKATSVNHRNNFIRENVTSFKNDKPFSRIKGVNSQMNSNLNTTVSLPSNSVDKSKNFIPNPATVVKSKKSIQPLSGINSKKNKAEFESKLQRRFSTTSVSRSKPSCVNLNSTVLVEELVNRAEFSEVNSIKCFEGGSENFEFRESHQDIVSITLNDKHPATVVKSEKNIQPPSGINSKKNKPEFESKLQRRFSTTSASRSKPSCVNLNSTVLVEKLVNRAEFSQVNSIKCFEGGGENVEEFRESHQDIVSTTLNDRHVSEKCASKSEKLALFTKNESSDANKNPNSDSSNKKSLLKINMSVKPFPSVTNGKKKLSPKRVSVTNKTSTLNQIKTASALPGSFPVINIRKQNTETNCAASKVKICENGNELFSRLPKTNGQKKVFFSKQCNKAYKLFRHC